MHKIFDKLKLKLSIVILLSTLFTAKISVGSDVAVLKTLFYTQTERKEIDESRFKSTKYAGADYVKRNEPGNGNLNNVKSKKEKQVSVKIDGYIKREDGRNVIWFNNTNTLNSNNVNKEIRFKPRIIDGGGIKLVSKSRNIKLKPGQVLQINSGKIQEQYKIQDSSAKMKIEKK